MASRISPYVDNTGLVFAYDLANVNRSYLGEPTTNLAAGLGLTDLGAGLSFVGVEDGWLKYSMSATWSGGGYPYSIALNGVSFTGGQPYSVVAILRTNVENKFNYFCTSGISYVNQPMDYAGTLSATLNPDGSRTVRRVNFAYTSTTGQLGYLFTNPINGITFNPATDFVYLKAFQAEQKPHPTPFTTGTRSVTQGLKDLTGNSTIDLTNVSFDGNAQMTFDGTNDYVDLGSDQIISPNNQGWTAEYVFNTNSASTLQHFNSAEADDFNANWLALLSSYLAVWDHGQGTWRYGSTQFNSNSFYHIAFVQTTGTTMQFYVNGIPEGGDHTTFSWSSNFSSLKTRYIGQYEYAGGYGRYFNGSIPYTRLYNRALLASEVLQNFNAIKGRYGL